MSEQSLESRLRPKNLKDYIGQKKIIESLRLFINAAIKRGKVAEHILFYGPPGIGKTTLAHIVSRELKGQLKITSGPAIERSGDLAAILTNLKDNDVLFIDEIHRMPKPVEEALYPVMEEFFLDIVIGKGPSARTVRLPVPKITIIGATTRIALLSAPLRDRFGLVLRLDYYSNEEMQEIITRSSEILGVKIREEASKLIAERSRNTPRLANRIVKRVRDLIEIEQQKEIDTDTVTKLFKILRLDRAGLTDIDNQYMINIIDKFGGGPVGVSTIAMTLSEDIQTIEEFIEPYLLQLGFISKSPKGRVATEKAYKHFKIQYKTEKDKQQKLV